MAAQTRLIYEFDEFQLEPDERKLMRHGQLIPLHGKAFEMLLVLIRNRGKLLTKDELFALVWPDQIVEESNLTVNISAIRRALGERANNPHYITTVSGRGYRFTGDVRQFYSEDTLTIERESFARVTVEHEETESGTTLASFATQIATALRRATSHPLLLSATALVVLTIAGVGLWTKLHRVAAAPLPWSNITIRRFAVNGGVPYRVAISPDGKSIAYVQRVNSKFSLWLGQVETNSSALLEDRGEGQVLYNAITFSRDGQTIYVTETNVADGTTKLVRMPALGGAQTQVASNVNSVATFSPDGRQLAFLRRQAHSASIIIIDSDGKNEHVLATRTEPQRFVGNGLSWSPDGKYIAIGTSASDDKSHELRLISIEGGNERTLGDHQWGCIKNVVWHDNGVLLIVASSEVARRSEIWFTPYPAGEPRRITNDLNQYYGLAMSASATGALAVLSAQMDTEIWIAPNGDPARARIAFQGAPSLYEAVDGLTWTADGHLLFSGYVADAQNIWEAAADGSNRKQLTSNTADRVDWQMTTSADNRYIVFGSNRSGSFEIWRANRDGSNLKQLTSGGRNSQPSISPDSKWIVFTSERDGGPALWRIPIEGGQPTKLTHYSSWQPQVSPDGKHIAYVGSSDSMPLYLGIVSFDGGEPEKLFPLTQKPQTNLAKHIRWTPDGKAVLYKGPGLSMWRQRLDHDKPEALKGFDDTNVFQFSWSFDGKNLAYTRGSSIQEVLLLQDT
jgi:Tol biopolymer transport system component/DNA-binding winged helix-turn-helix (wHTH) protein